MVASKHEGIAIGDRYYGYYPMSTFCTLQPIKVSQFGFSDGTAHRQELAAIYNNYTNVAADMATQEVLQYLSNYSIATIHK